MTENEAIHKLEYSKKAYQTLIDEKVDSGKLVGDGVRGEWKAETSLDEVYKSMIEALELAIKALEQQPCEDVISRQAAIDAIYKQYIGGKDAIKNAPINDLYAEGLSEAVDAVWELPSVAPKVKMGRCETDHGRI